MQIFVEYILSLPNEHSMNVAQVAEENRCKSRHDMMERKQQLLLFGIKYKLHRCPQSLLGMVEIMYTKKKTFHHHISFCSVFLLEKHVHKKDQVKVSRKEPWLL